MPNPTQEGSAHLRDEGPSGRWLNLAFVALLPVLACFLGGATQRWGEGIVFALLGIYLVARPPRFSLGLVINLVLVAFLLWSLIAFLPAGWVFFTAWGRRHLTDIWVLSSATA